LLHNYNFKNLFLYFWQKLEDAEASTTIAMQAHFESTKLMEVFFIFLTQSYHLLRKMKEKSLIAVIEYHIS